MAHQNVITMGTGNIGTEFIAQVAEQDAPHLEKHPNPTNILGMVNNTGWLYTPGGIAIQNSPSLVRDLQAEDRELVSQGRPRTAMKDWMQEQPRYTEGGNLLELFEEIRKQGLVDDVVFVDLTANDLTSFHQKVIESGGKIVTANKIPVAQSSWDIFKLLTQFRRRYGFSCSVMAGAGAVPFLRDAFDTSDTVKSIEGCFSGTLGKLCNLLYEGKITFSDAVKQLKVGGDTEPDPRDDLSGMDVAKKIVILARTAGYQVDLKDVEIEPFVPGGFRELADCSVDEFMAEASIFDKEIAGKFESAKKQGKTLRYVASLKTEGGKPIVTLGLREEELDSPLGSLKGNGNKIVVYTLAYSQVPYELSAPGSGTHITAGNVRRDLLQLLKDREM
jgi:homoserine dehydrogenase